MSVVITAPTAETPEEVIKSSAFWPDVEPAKVREAMRIDETVTPPRLRAAVIEAIASVNHQLAPFRLSSTADGYTTLADVPAEEVDGASEKVHRYLRAVGCIAKANLLERLRDYDITGRGDKKADTTDPTIDDLRRDAAWAISDIAGRPRTTVELI